MIDAFDKNMMIIAGENPKSTQEKQLNATDKKKISDEYFKLFFNLTYSNWLRGGNLGAAWYSAIEQIKQFVTAKNANNPASMYMRQIFVAHNARWAQVMMTNRHRNDVIDAPATQKQSWRERAAKNTTAALKALNDTVAAYTPRAQAKANATNAQPAQVDALRSAAQKMQMLIMTQMRQRHVNSN